MWNKWIRKKYHCSQDKDLSLDLSGKKISNFMSDLSKLQDSTWLGSNLKSCNLVWEVGNGDLSLFWEDIWFEDNPLLERFQKLYSLSNLKNEVVRNIIDLWECYVHDSFVFWSRSLRAWELEDMNKLGKIISSVKLNGKEDKLIWLVSGDKFSTKSGLASLDRIEAIADWKWYFIWKIQVPPKVKLFLWKLHSKILPTYSFLRKRINAQFVCDLCQFCLLEVEDQSHLLWKCTLSKKIWQAVLAWWGLADKVNIENLESMWRSRKIFSIKILRKIWELVLAATIWSIWLARNDKIFNGKEAVTPVLLQMIKFRSLSWGIAYGIILQSKSAWWSENPSGVVTASLRSKWFNIMSEEQCFNHCIHRW